MRYAFDVLAAHVSFSSPIADVCGGCPEWHAFGSFRSLTLQRDEHQCFVEHLCFVMYVLCAFIVDGRLHAL